MLFFSEEEEEKEDWPILENTYNIYIYVCIIWLRYYIYIRPLFFLSFETMRDPIETRVRVWWTKKGKESNRERVINTHHVLSPSSLKKNLFGGQPKQ